LSNKFTYLAYKISYQTRKLCKENHLSWSESYSSGLGYSGSGGMGTFRWFKVTFTLWIISFNLFLPNKLFYEHIFHVLLWLILTNSLQTSVRTWTSQVEEKILKISEINVKATKIKILRLLFPLLWKTPNDMCILWKNFDQKVVSPGKWGMKAGTFWIFYCFDVHFASFVVWNLAFLRNVWAFHFCSMWILTTTAIHSPKVHFYGGHADNFQLWFLDSLSKSLSQKA
jgi:hypothetical protein